MWCYYKEVMSGAGSYEEESSDFAGNFRGIKDNVEIF